MDQQNDLDVYFQIQIETFLGDHEQREQAILNMLNKQKKEKNIVLILVKNLHWHFTEATNNIKEQAILLVLNILEKQKEELQQKQINSLLEFFFNKIKEVPSAQLHILKIVQTLLYKDQQILELTVQELQKNLSKFKQGNREQRQQYFQVLKKYTEYDENYQINNGFIQLLIQSVKGEVNPQNLLTGLQLFHSILDHLENQLILKQIYDILDIYYPIEEESYVEQQNALDDCLLHQKMQLHSLDLILKKVTSSYADSNVLALKTTNKLLNTYYLDSKSLFKISDNLIKFIQNYQDSVFLIEDIYSECILSLYLLIINKFERSNFDNILNNILDLPSQCFYYLPKTFIKLYEFDQKLKNDIFNKFLVVFLRIRNNYDNEDKVNMYEFFVQTFPKDINGLYIEYERLDKILSLFDLNDYKNLERNIIIFNLQLIIYFSQLKESNQVKNRFQLLISQAQILSEDKTQNEQVRLCAIDSCMKSLKSLNINYDNLLTYNKLSDDYKINVYKLYYKAKLNKNFDILINDLNAVEKYILKDQEVGEQFYQFILSNYFEDQKFNQLSQNQIKSIQNIIKKFANLNDNLGYIIRDIISNNKIKKLQLFSLIIQDIVKFFNQIDIQQIAKLELNNTCIQNIIYYYSKQNQKYELLDQYQNVIMASCIINNNLEQFNQINEVSNNISLIESLSYLYSIDESLSSPDIIIHILKETQDLNVQIYGLLLFPKDKLIQFKEQMMKILVEGIKQTDHQNQYNLINLICKILKENTEVISSDLSLIITYLLNYIEQQKYQNQSQKFQISLISIFSTIIDVYEQNLIAEETISKEKQQFIDIKNDLISVLRFKKTIITMLKGNFINHRKRQVRRNAVECINKWWLL